ncbi:hypothetical protein BROUX41_005946 [Berkeleyomyces rouxiae]|uniref:uncharacterized protein n=1 Tax=Berkeleyomyces rouxiae TaxID=2035830 RepID=UPI003B7A4793
MVRIKERYILINVLSPPSPSNWDNSDLPDFVKLHRPITENLNPRVLLKAIRAEVSSLFGQYGLGTVDSGLSATFILKASRKYYRLVWAALTMMNRIPGSTTPCVFHVVHVSGTIRKTEERAIERARKLVLMAKDHASGKARDQLLQATFGDVESVMDVDAFSDGGNE